MAVSLQSVPAMGHFLPKAALLTIALHCLVFAAFVLLPGSDVGGGGKVLGRMSVSLGGSGEAGSRTPSNMDTAEVDDVAASSVVLPEPRAVVEPQSVRPPVVETPGVSPSAPVVSAPVVPEPVEEAHLVEDMLPILDAGRPPGDERDGNPVGETIQGSRTLGENASSATVGLGTNAGNLGNERNAYLAAIRTRIEMNRIFPSAARRENAEGSVLMQVTIDRQGGLVRSEIIAGAGSFHLDRAAKRMIEKSVPFPRPPTAPFTTTIPIVFSLR